VEGIATPLDDPMIPKSHVIQYTPSGNFKVWSVGRQAADGIAESYAQAIKLANKKSVEEAKRPAPRRKRMVSYQP
jgi:hypothetical protein